MLSVFSYKRRQHTYALPANSQFHEKTVLNTHAQTLFPM